MRSSDEDSIIVSHLPRLWENYMMLSAPACVAAVENRAPYRCKAGALSRRYAA